MNKKNKMIIKKFGVDFFSEYGALTLNEEDVTDLNINVDYYYTEYTKTHDDGWTISGVVKEDYYTWVNEFKAVHPVYGKVWGDFEDKVYADSEIGFQHFWQHHTPTAWDYRDI